MFISRSPSIDTDYMRLPVVGWVDRTFGGVEGYDVAWPGAGPWSSLFFGRIVGLDLDDPRVERQK